MAGTCNGKAFANGGPWFGITLLFYHAVHNKNVFSWQITRSRCIDGKKWMKNQDFGQVEDDGEGKEEIMIW